MCTPTGHPPLAPAHQQLTYSHQETAQFFYMVLWIPRQWLINPHLLHTNNSQYITRKLLSFVIWCPCTLAGCSKLPHAKKLLLPENHNLSTTMCISFSFIITSPRQEQHHISSTLTIIGLKMMLRVEQGSHTFQTTRSMSTNLHPKLYMQ